MIIGELHLQLLGQDKAHRFSLAIIGHRNQTFDLLHAGENDAGGGQRVTLPSSFSTANQRCAMKWKISPVCQILNDETLEKPRC